METSAQAMSALLYPKKELLDVRVLGDKRVLVCYAQ